MSREQPVLTGSGEAQSSLASSRRDPDLTATSGLSLAARTFLHHHFDLCFFFNTALICAYRTHQQGPRDQAKQASLASFRDC